MQTPIKKVRGLGSAQNGTHHWVMQKITAMALVPLTIWFVASLVCFTGADYQSAVAWVASPINAVLLILFLVTGIYHLKLGLQVVIEDYIHAEFPKFIIQMIITFGCFTIGVAVIFSILKIAL